MVAVLTSAVRDAANGAEFERELRAAVRLRGADDLGRARGAAHLPRRDEPAARTTSPLLVLDIGGGSTELVVGQRATDVEFFVSTQIGSVRYTERHLHTDPPTPAELAACRAAVRAELEAAVPADVRERVREGIAVAGTPTSFAAIDLRARALRPRARATATGSRSPPASGSSAELAALPARRAPRGSPGCIPTARPRSSPAASILVEAMRLFGLEEIEVSERDILDGAALEARRKTPEKQPNSPHFEAHDMD